MPCSATSCLVTGKPCSATSQNSRPQSRQPAQLGIIATSATANTPAENEALIDAVAWRDGPTIHFMRSDIENEEYDVPPTLGHELLPQTIGAQHAQSPSATTIPMRTSRYTANKRLRRHRRSDARRPSPMTRPMSSWWMTPRAKGKARPLKLLAPQHAFHHKVHNELRAWVRGTTAAGGAPVPALGATLTATSRVLPTTAAAPPTTDELPSGPLSRTAGLTEFAPAQRA